MFTILIILFAVVLLLRWVHGRGRVSGLREGIGSSVISLHACKQEIDDKLRSKIASGSDAGFHFHLDKYVLVFMSTQEAAETSVELASFLSRLKPATELPCTKQ